MVQMMRNCSGQCLALVLLLGTSALGQDHFVSSSFTYIPPPASPAALSWRLAKQNGEFVEFIAPPATHTPRQIVHLVTPNNASEFGVDFSAWSAAVNDPSYNRSIISFGGVDKEEPWSNPWTPFELERIALIVDDFDGRSTAPSVIGEVVDLIPVPEPGTSWIVATSAALLGLHARRRTAV
jgi:hypothetical protein